jgi:hypothetical protein
MVKFILKARLACCNKGTKKSLENILIPQNKTSKKQPTFHDNTSSAERKVSLYITYYKLHVQPSEFTSHQRQYRRGLI